MKTKRVMERWACSFRPRAELAIALSCALWVVWVASAGEQGYVAHEWGTFTSLQRGDGELITWRPLRTSELPKFVHDWGSTGLIPAGWTTLAQGKGGIEARQRMETPVIYFYSDADRLINVEVGFPAGLVTEWYPEASALGPATIRTEKTGGSTMAEMLSCSTPGRAFSGPTGLQESGLHWSDVRILAAGSPSAHEPFADASARHYFAARETKASLLEVPSPASKAQAYETEKFLFYRGVGNFTTPLKVMAEPGGLLTLINSGDLPLARIFVLEVASRTTRLVSVESLGKGNQRVIKMGEVKALPLSEGAFVLKHELTESLQQAGLYREEAAAMVATWQDSWFTEQGTRVLYLLPRAWTDRTLPLKIQPAPVETVRVMVGRAELLTPEVQARLTKALERGIQGGSKGRSDTIAALQALGRFGEPALRLATAKFGKEERARACELLAAAQAAPPAAVVRN